MVGVEGDSAKFQSGVSDKLLKTESSLCSMTYCGNYGCLDFILSQGHTARIVPEELAVV